MVYNLPVHFAGGAFFVGWHGRKFGANDVDDYFAVMDSLRPLFAQPDFNTSTIGFHLNWIGSPDDIAVRLNYFSLNVPETIRVVEKFANDSGPSQFTRGNPSTATNRLRTTMMARPRLNWRSRTSWMPTRGYA